MSGGETPATTPSAAEALVRAEAMTVRYQGTPEPAVTGVSLAVGPGAGLVVTGAEGSGKTTVVRAVIGLVPHMDGSLEVLGGSPLDPAVRRRIGYCPERRAFPGTMRVAEAVGLVACLRGVTGDGAVAAALGAAGLPGDDRRPIGRLEVEDVRRVSFACALAGDPDLLVLDDPWEFPETVEALRAARARGAGILLATPDPGGFPDVVGPVLTLPGGGEDG